MKESKAAHSNLYCAACWASGPGSGWAAAQDHLGRVVSSCARRLRSRGVLRALITLAIVVIASPSPARAEPVFLRSATGVVTTFDVLGGTNVQVFALNNPGQVTGAYFAGGTQHGFLRDASGAITTFDPPGATISNATALNDLGQVAGTYVASAVSAPASAVFLGTGLVVCLAVAGGGVGRQAKA